MDRAATRSYIAFIAGSFIRAPATGSGYRAFALTGMRAILEGRPQTPASDVVIEVTEGYGEWFVRVSEGEANTVVSFEAEAQARTFAAGQRLKLAVSLR